MTEGKTLVYQWSSLLSAFLEQANQAFLGRTLQPEIDAHHLGQQESFYCIGDHNQWMWLKTALESVVLHRGLLSKPKS
ncbi:hypothetical protein YC2023_021626 [Brassica napus]